MKVDWKKFPVDLAICSCNTEFPARVAMPRFGYFIADRPCPNCLRFDGIREVVNSGWLPRVLHLFKKLFSPE